jgi:hypothetical protein
MGTWINKPTPQTHHNPSVSISQIWDTLLMSMKLLKIGYELTIRKLRNIFQPLSDKSKI